MATFDILAHIQSVHLCWYHTLQNNYLVNNIDIRVLWLLTAMFKPQIARNASRSSGAIATIISSQVYRYTYRLCSPMRCHVNECTLTSLTNAMQPTMLYHYLAWINTKKFIKNIPSFSQISHIVRYSGSPLYSTLHHK